MSISPINTGRTEFHAENFSVLVPLNAVFPLPNPVETVIATYIIPSKCRGRLLELGNYIGTVAAWGLIRWHFNCNGIPQAPYNAVLDQIGYAAQRSQVERLEVGGASIITVTANNDSAAAVQVGVSMAWELIFQE
jgi:hypothetical protein